MNTMTTRKGRDLCSQVLSAVQGADSVLLFCHISPDGDTLGSAMALRLRLAAMGKSVRVLLDGEVPSSLDYLLKFGEVEKPGEPWAADLALAVDVSCRERLGACEKAFDAARRTALVDHHGSNPGFADLSWIDGDAPATAVVVYRLLEAMGGPVSRDEAIGIFWADCAENSARKNLRDAIYHLKKLLGEDVANQTMFISHSDCEADAQFVADQIKAKYGTKEIILNDIGPVIGAHTGPGCVALFFMGKHR